MKNDNDNYDFSSYLYPYDDITSYSCYNERKKKKSLSYS